MAKPNIRKQIDENSKDLKDIMKEHLSQISNDYIDQVMVQVRKLSPAQRLAAIRKVSMSGVGAYKSLIVTAMAVIAQSAIQAARKEVPKAKNVSLADTTELDKLPPKLRSKIKTRADLLVGKQIGDLQKVIDFAYATSEDTTDSNDMIESDLRDSAVGWLDGSAVEAGAQITAATIINEARNAFFFDSDVLDQIDAFEFVNGDPVTPICQDLAGTIFSKEDPEAFRYTPPLHWNCKSYIVPILAGNLGDREIEKLKPSKASLEQYIQFHEHEGVRCVSESVCDVELVELFKCIVN